MKISNHFPPNYAEFLKHFPSLPSQKPIFCYGETIYNPYERTITPDLEVHEKVHSERQGNFVEVWYEKYFRDPGFRLEEEVMAYGTQYAFIKQHMRGELLNWGLENMAAALSGELYGNLCTFGEAKSKIRNFAKYSVV